MILMPKKTKYRKAHRGRMKGDSRSGNEIAFGEYGLQAIERSNVSSKQIESARKALTHFIKRGGKIWIRIFPDKPMTLRPAETRMGGGKGAPEFYVAVVKPGRILFEISGINKIDAVEAMRLAGHKLPLLTRFIAK